MSLASLNDKQLEALLDQLKYETKREGVRLYKPQKKQQEFHAAGKDYREVMFAAGNQCITPWTFLETQGSTVRCADILFEPSSRVQALAGGKEQTVDTQGWFLRGIAPAFRVLLDTGRWFDCSAEHQALTDEGYLPIAQLVLRAGGLRYWRTHADLQASCATGDYLGGQRPHLEEGSAQASPRTLRDAHGCSLSWRLGDAMARTPEHIRSCLASGHQPTAAGDRQHFEALFERFSGPVSCTPSQLTLGDIQAQTQLVLALGDGLRSSRAQGRHQVSCPGLSKLDLDHCVLETIEPLPEAYLSASPSQRQLSLQDAMHEAVLGAEEAAIYIPYSPLKLIGAAIVALVPIGYQPLIDTQVPDLHNFKAGGVFHHNCGKSYSAAAELAIHLTGEYPTWWEGRRWDRPISAWCAGVTGESTRDTLQRLLMGPPGSFGTGAIPADCIVSYTSGRGVAEALDTVIIKHKSGGQSTLGFKSYALQREKWQGSTLDLVAFDEEPPADVFLEGLTRTNATNGRVWLTFTPLLGMSEVASRFFEQESPDRKLISATIEDAAHYTPEQRARIIASYPAHEREARTKGIPSLGSGRVFPLAEEQITVEPFAIPKHWPKICGVDFGWDHDAAAAWLAWDRDTDTLYLYDVFKMREATPQIQAPAIRARGAWIPVAWPHDGLQHDKGSGIQLAEQYRAAGVNMLGEKATHAPAFGQREGEGGFGLEAGISEMLERMETGRWKVFNHLADWLAEFRLYHRDGGQIVKKRDDAISASRIAMMMKRFASVEPRSGTGKVHTVNFGARKGGY